jgi:tRNA threonylcarbamoyladenosine biosynthesis protein TsaB
MYLLGIDTCGPSGSVALGRLTAGAPDIIAQKELAGRTYSASLIAAVQELLAGQGIRVRDLGCIVVVKGPGSFTGVRVGLSAAKGLADGAGIAIVAVSRLEVLAEKAGVPWAALDAHRHEVFLRVAGAPAEQFGIRELLGGAKDLALMDAPSDIGVCDDAAEELLRDLWQAARLHRVHSPTAADALAVAAPAIVARSFADIALLDGHYLRRSDAEIFGNTVTNT